jgi:hypothetical protein
VGGHKYRLDSYLELAEEMLRTGKQTMAGARASGETNALKVELDRIERKYGSWQLNPEAVHLVRMAMEKKLQA